MVLGYVLFVILWGAFVRASGSGAGCGDHWPLCEGSLIPPSPALTTLVELLHRATSGLALLLVVGLLLAARRHLPAGDAARRWAAIATIFIIIESLIGALIVRAGLFGSNASLTRGALVGLHFVNTLLLLAALTLSLWWAMHGPVAHDTAAQAPGGRWDAATLALAIGALGWLLLGASGAVGALSRSVYPSNSLAESLAREFATSAPLLVRLRSLHPLMAGIMGAHTVLASLLVASRRHDVRLRQLAVAMSALFVAQCLLGLLNVLSVIPTPSLQISHLLLMDAMWIGYVWLGMSAWRQAPIIARCPTRSSSSTTVLNSPS